jgi:hypothetical protein
MGNHKDGKTERNTKKMGKECISGVLETSE